MGGIIVLCAEGRPPSRPRDQQHMRCWEELLTKLQAGDRSVREAPKRKAAEVLGRTPNLREAAQLCIQVLIC